jgi:hypothetical protein
VSYGGAKAASVGISNVRWVTGFAETVVLEGPFELIAIGNAFHRLNRSLVAERMFDWIHGTGGVALLWAAPHRVVRSRDRRR